MLNLSSLLEKFKHLKNPKVERERLVSLLSTCVGFEIPFNSVDVRQDIVYINVSGYVKTEVFMRKESILELLTKEGFKISDIK